MYKINGIRVTRKGNTIFIPLPPGMQIPIQFGCKCSFCKAHPDKVPMWDTLAIYEKAPSNPWDTATTVHYPELQEKK